MEVEQDVRTVSPQRRTNQAPPVQNRASRANQPQTRQPPARHSKPQQSHWSAGAVTKTTVTAVESDDDEESSDVSELQEIDFRQLQNSRDQNSNVDRRSFSKGKHIITIATGGFMFFILLLMYLVCFIMVDHLHLNINHKKD